MKKKPPNSYTSSLRFPFILIFVSLCSCTQLTQSGMPKTSQSAHKIFTKIEDSTIVDEHQCTEAQFENHSLYQITVDGKDVGREYRSTFKQRGPFGDEKLILSHTSIKTAFGEHFFDRGVVRAERTSASDGTLLRGSYIHIEPVSSTISQVGFNGDGWDRVVETKQSITSPIQKRPSQLSLSGQEIIGLNLNQYMQKVFQGQVKNNSKILYYDPSMNCPTELLISIVDAQSNQDATISAEKWVVASLVSVNRVFIKILYAADGTPIEEHYPSIHQVRKLTGETYTCPKDSLSSTSGLFSDAYLGAVNAATHATYDIEFQGKVKEEVVAMLNAPNNQQVVNQTQTGFSLIVTPGSPDELSPPDKKDLETTRLILPKHPRINRALKYLKSCGKNGGLSEIRKDNATAVIAKCAYLPKQLNFWGNPDDVAGMIMEYVYALIPTKRHAPGGLVDAITILERGYGDCREHSILFTTLMRANKIPTRLLSGIFLTSGGKWEPHLWAEYYNGVKWQQIDPANRIKNPGALYISFGLGSPHFDKMKSTIAKFLDSTFSGVAFDLVKASSNGEILRLAKPKTGSKDKLSSSFSGAFFLSSRGNFEKALTVIDANPQITSASIQIRLFRISLLIETDREAEALREIEKMRRLTSKPSNVFLLNTYEYETLLAMNKPKKAEELLTSFAKTLKSDPISYIILKCKHLFKIKESNSAIKLLELSLGEYPESIELLQFYANAYYDHYEEIRSQSTKIEEAVNFAKKAVFLSAYADTQSLVALAKMLLLQNKSTEAKKLLDHALILMPDALEIKNLIKKANCQK